MTFDEGGIAFRFKDYRIDGRDRWKTMTLHSHEFIRRFLIHVLPKGFHRIRHYGLFANGNRSETIARARELLAVATAERPKAADAPSSSCDWRYRSAVRRTSTVPLLRRAYAHHRDLRVRRNSAAPAVAADRRRSRSIRHDGHRAEYRSVIILVAGRGRRPASSRHNPC